MPTATSKGSCTCTICGGRRCFRVVTDIKLLLFDVDGVLTDGTIVVHADGSESKQFSIRDGAGMVWAQRAGLTIGLLSARTADATAIRAAQLGIKIVSQGIANKLAGYEQIL